MVCRLASVGCGAPRADYRDGTFVLRQQLATDVKHRWEVVYLLEQSRISIVVPGDDLDAAARDAFHFGVRVYVLAAGRNHLRCPVVEPGALQFGARCRPCVFKRPEVFFEQLDTGLADSRDLCEGDPEFSFTFNHS